MNRFVFRKKKEAWSEITEAFNAEGIGKTRTANELKRLWGNQNKKVKKVHIAQSSASQDPQGPGHNRKLSQAMKDVSSLSPNNDGPEEGQQTITGAMKIEAPLQQSTADQELVTSVDLDNDTKEDTMRVHPVERRIREAELKVVETQAKIEEAQLRSLERQAKIEEAQLRCLERQARLIEAKLKAKLEEVHLRNLERQAKIDESHLKILERQGKIEEARARILERQIKIEYQL
ncbi:involucrin-like [Penaeus monodon]|uniref:involucrin-like n=1 Tax=Penaeus monodon TaxID=6687 RepID=UPI0018A76852|nr:involucrin-like [Penaeus monodon]